MRYLVIKEFYISVQILYQFLFVGELNICLKSRLVFCLVGESNICSKFGKDLLQLSQSSHFAKSTDCQVAQKQTTIIYIQKKSKKKEVDKYPRKMYTKFSLDFLS